MPSSKTYLNYVLEQLSGLHDITYRVMMGEYILYYRGKIVGGIYDNRLLVKPVKSAMDLMPDAEDLEHYYRMGCVLRHVDGVTRECDADTVDGIDRETELELVEEMRKVITEDK